MCNRGIIINVKMQCWDPGGNASKDCRTRSRTHRQPIQQLSPKVTLMTSLKLKICIAVTEEGIVPTALNHSFGISARGPIPRLSEEDFKVLFID